MESPSVYCPLLFPYLKVALEVNVRLCVGYLTVVLMKKEDSSLNIFREVSQ